jgi:thiamine-phosphate pyrophosphorylase
LYAIVDREWFRKRGIESIATQLLKGGVDVIQYRDKISDTDEIIYNAQTLRRMTRNQGIPLIINDRLDVAMAVDADGIHIGQNDMPASIIRLLAPELMVGVSVSSVEEFEQVKDADYFGIGAVFSTETKENVTVSGLKLVREIRKRTNLTLIGIGGINSSNAGEAIRAGCNGVAVISALLGVESIDQATVHLKRIVLDAKGTI